MSKIHITQFDYDRLQRRLAKKPAHDDFDKALLVELEKAEIVDPKKVPADVITMNSQVHFSDEHGDDWYYWLVFPEDADLKNRKISVLSPIGCALLGYRRGDTITLHTPHGRKQLKVEEIIHQPEAESRYDS
jgi:regulator of nucleoside diphosphate kinase